MIRGILKRTDFFFRNTTIQSKLMLSFFLLIFFPLCILTTISYKTVAKYYENSVEFSAEQSFSQAYTLLVYRIDSVINSSSMVYSDMDIQHVLVKKQEQTDIVNQNIDMITLNNFLFNVEHSQDVVRVVLYVPSWMMFSEQGRNYNNFDRYKTAEEYQKLLQCENIAMWLLPEEITNPEDPKRVSKVISMVREIKDINKLSNIIGVVKVSILESSVKDILIRANIIKSGIVFLQNSEGSIISCSDADMLKAADPDNEINRLDFETDYNWSKINIRDRDFMVTTKALKHTDWRLVSLIPYSAIFTQSNEIKDIMFVLTFVLGVVAYGLSYIISRSITKRIVLLSEKIAYVQEGDFTVKMTLGNNDEIGKLIGVFNFMVERIKVLLEEQYTLGKNIKTAEFKALQAQINPHFLYNTLDLINWKAIDNNVPEIAEASQWLARFYKISLSEGRDIIPFEAEVEHLKTYVRLQNLRFDNRIKLILDISEEVYECSVLKLILQPLAENSILHGILERRDQSEGIIRLVGRHKNGTVILAMQDNGVGMPEEQVKTILTGEYKSHGYGVQNIDKRIKLYYGQEYGLTYYSPHRKGTTVIIKFKDLGDGGTGTLFQK